MAKKKKAEVLGPLRSYHFSVGNSTKGAVGFCARVKAHSEEEAVRRLQDNMPRELGSATDRNVEYFRVYFNSDAVTKRHIDEINPIEEPSGNRNS